MRHYDVGAGQFTQPDPIGLAGGLNLYGYADGDPINFSDPFGLCPKSAGGDGKTEELADCPRGSAGWWAWRDAQGEGSRFVNNVAGTFASLFGGRPAAFDRDDIVLVGVPSWMGGPAAGEMTAAQIIAKFKRGSVMEVFPGEFLNVKFNEVEALARQGVRAAQTAYKLLKQTRFNR